MITSELYSAGYRFDSFYDIFFSGTKLLLDISGDNSILPDNVLLCSCVPATPRIELVVLANQATRISLASQIHN